MKTFQHFRRFLERGALPKLHGFFQNARHRFQPRLFLATRSFAAFAAACVAAAVAGGVRGGVRGGGVVVRVVGVVRVVHGGRVLKGGVGRHSKRRRRRRLVSFLRPPPPGWVRPRRVVQTTPTPTPTPTTAAAVAAAAVVLHVRPA